VSHKLERLLQDLGKPEVDVAGQLLDDIVGERGNANRLGDVSHVVGVPDRHGGGGGQRAGAADGATGSCGRAVRFDEADRDGEPVGGQRLSPARVTQKRRV
jgi:hypothetical protein